MSPAAGLGMAAGEVRAANSRLAASTSATSRSESFGLSMASYMRMMSNCSCP